MSTADLIWMNGEFVKWEDAKVHVLTHGLHYGTGVFEGGRCYDTELGPAVFRNAEHVERLLRSAELYYMPVPFTAEQIRSATLELVARNGMRSCYIRPIIFRGFGDRIGVNPLNNPVEVFIACWPWGKYLGDESENGVDVCVSSWRRIAADSMPAVAKATGNYLNGQLIKIEAVTNGYVEGIALDARGFRSEGSGENLFMVQDGVLLTPPLAASVLQGITRDTVVKLARDLGIPVREEQIPRGQLYTCEELFMTGTAAEITPIRSADGVAPARSPRRSWRGSAGSSPARSRTATAGCTRSIIRRRKARRRRAFRRPSRRPRRDS